MFMVIGSEDFALGTRSVPHLNRTYVITKATNCTLVGSKLLSGAGQLVLDLRGNGHDLHGSVAVRELYHIT